MVDAYAEASGQYEILPPGKVAQGVKESVLVTESGHQLSTA